MNELGTLFSASRVTGDTLVWRDGMEAWSPLSMVSSLYAQVTLAKVALLPKALPSGEGGPNAVGGGFHAAPDRGSVPATNDSGEVHF